MNLLILSFIIAATIAFVMAISSHRTNDPDRELEGGCASFFAIAICFAITIAIILSFIHLCL